MMKMSQNVAGNKIGVHSKTKAEANLIPPSKSASGTAHAFGSYSGYISERTPNVALIRAK